MSWFFITLLAVIFQSGRYTFAKKLSRQVSAETVTLCRFLYGIPIVLIGYFIMRSLFGSVAITSWYFFLFIFLLSLSQIMATIFLISLFSHKNYAVSITYAKTETIFAAILALILLSEFPSVLGWVGIIISFLGFVGASLAKERIQLSTLKRSFSTKSTLLGLMAGLLFAIAAISIKKSFSYLESDQIIMKPIFALFINLFVQVGLLIPFIYAKRKNELLAIIKYPRIPFMIGTFSALSSFFWNFAFALTYVAYVKTIGQTEFVLSVVISSFYFKEKIYRNEILGMIFMIVGTLILIFS